MHPEANVVNGLTSQKFCIQFWWTCWLQKNYLYCYMVSS